MLPRLGNAPVTTSAQTIDRLADLVGIEPFFHDIWGNRYDVVHDTKSALLAALGLAVGSDAEIGLSLRRIEEASWRRLLPPVLVLGDGQAMAIPVTPGDSDQPLTWTLTQEDGTVHQGAVSPRRPGDQRRRRDRRHAPPTPDLGAADTAALGLPPVDRRPGRAFG